MELVLTRNGRTVVAQVITAATLKLPPVPIATSSAAPSSITPTENQPAELPLPSAADFITAAAAAILWQLAQCHKVLGDSLEPVHRWESLALQAIASTGDRQLDSSTKIQLLTIAVDLDHNNWSAAQARAVALDDPLTQDGARNIAAVLEDLAKAAQPYTGTKSGPRPVQIRTQFNRAAVLANAGLLKVLQTPSTTPAPPGTERVPQTLLDAAQTCSAITDPELKAAEAAFSEVEDLIRQARTAGQTRNADPKQAEFLDGFENAALYGRIALMSLIGRLALVDGIQPAVAIAASPVTPLGSVSCYREDRCRRRATLSIG